jgi:MFS family permease
MNEPGRTRQPDAGDGVTGISLRRFASKWRGSRRGRRGIIAAARAAWDGVEWDARQGGKTGVTAVLTVTQWLSWSSTYYLVTVLAGPIVQDTGWSLTFVVAGLSLGLVIAGLASPFVGRAIELYGGGPILGVGSLTLALGLIDLGLAPNRFGYIAAWAILGVGMAASLYDAAFAALGRLYGLRARTVISNLMLIMAFTGTLSWPATALLTDALGWRGACLAYAGLHLLLALPLHFLLLPGKPGLPVPDAAAPAATAGLPAVVPGVPRGRRRLVVMWFLGANVTLQIVIGSVVTVHLLSLLQAIGVAYTAAVGLSSMIWLSQGGGRLVEALAGRRFHPVAQGVAASLLVLVGLALLLAGKPWTVGVGLALYGLGNGVRGILKGTLPLALFGAEGYARLVGRLGLPTLIAQAVGPALGSVALARWGILPLLIALLILAALNLLLSSALRMALPRRGLDSP